MTRHYLLRQPSTLESMATDQLARWIVTQATRSPAALHHLEPDAADAALSRHIARVRACLHCNVPRGSHDSLMSLTITQLYLLALLDTNTATRMVETLFTDNLTSLSLNCEHFEMFRDLLRFKSQLLTGLVRLQLNFDRLDIRFYSGNIETDVIQLLQQLHTLKCLTMNTVCTDNVLRCIVKNCTLIEEINLYAHQISDDAINMLNRLRNLRNITINTDLRCKGIQILLLSCNNNIEHISINEKIYYYDINNRLPRVLKRFASSEGNSQKRFNLKSYTVYRDTLEEMKTVFRMCPLIQNLTVHGDRITQNNIMAIIDLHELRELTLIEYGFYSGQVTRALQAVGGSLERLQLLQVTQIDLNAIIDISQMCPNLESLSLQRCTFIDHTSQTKEINIPPFRCLNTLSLDLTSCLYSPKQPIDLTLHTTLTLKLMQEPAFFLLTNCLNVEYIEFSETFMLMEEIMLHILDKNPLIYLKELKIKQLSKILRSTTAQTPSVIDHIIQNCRNRPEVIQDFDY